MADIAGALRSIINSIFHLSTAHEAVAAAQPQGSGRIAGMIAKANEELTKAQALLNGEPEDKPAEPPPPADPIDPVVGEPDAVPVHDPADTSADELNKEELESLPPPPPPHEDTQPAA